MADIFILRDNIQIANSASPGAWLPGMVVDIFDDGRIGPGKEQHHRFFLVRIPGLAKAKVEDLLEQLDDVQIGPVTEYRMVARRKLSLDFTKVPQLIKNKIGKDREITITETQLRNFLKAKTAQEVSRG